MRRLNGRTALLSPGAGVNQADLAYVSLHSKPGCKCSGDGKEFLFGYSCRSRHRGSCEGWFWNASFNAAAVRSGRKWRSGRRNQLLHLSKTVGEACELLQNVLKRGAKVFGIGNGYGIVNRFTHGSFLRVEYCLMASHSGINPCFFVGRSSLLVCRYSSACDI